MSKTKISKQKIRRTSLNQNLYKQNQSTKYLMNDYGSQNSLINISYYNADQTSKLKSHKNMIGHKANPLEMIYSHSGDNTYIPDHLKSVNIRRLIFESENPSSFARSDKYKKYDYDKLYRQREQRYQSLRSSSLKKSRVYQDKWAHVPSQIKFFTDQDRKAYSKLQKKSRKTKQSSKNKAEPHPDDFLSQESYSN